MNEIEHPTGSSVEPISAQEHPVAESSFSEDDLPVEIQKLPPEMRTMVSVMAGFFRSTSGPDADTAKILAQTEMHEESCKLDAFKHQLLTRDQQNQRDHIFRVKKMNHETAKSVIVMVVCLGGIICGLYLIVAKKDSTVGTPLLVASFMAMLGGKSILGKDKAD
jgi:hypothetical protein